ncbi:MAG: DUF1156 domain-containing protein [Deltaproteobacteria bacterium]
MRRLIDRGLAAAVSAAGRRERYGRGRTPHTALTWWARRPHAAMRAAVFAALVDDSPEHRALADALAVDEAPEAELRRAVGAGKRLLDPFAGGGTIPLEAKRLGVDAVAVDNNELAVMINRCWLEWVPATSDEERVATTTALGERAIAIVERLTADLFPLRGRAVDERVPTHYVFTYRSHCACGYRFHLSRRRWLSTRDRVALTPSMHGDEERLSLGDVAVPPHAACPRCGDAVNAKVNEAEDALVAVVYGARGRGKRYDSKTHGACPPDHVLATRSFALRAALGVDAPTAELYAWSGIVNPPLHGLHTHDAVFTPRQRAVLYATIGAIREVTAELDADERRFYRAVLSGLVDQCVDWNSRLSMWIPQNEQVGRALSGPGVPMLWDFVETDPVSRGPANLHDKLTRIANGVAALPVEPRGRAVHASAQRLPFEDASFDAVVTDPPYYDNIYYAALADFVYVWKRLLLDEDAPDLFAAERTRTAGELVASRQRFGADAHAVYVRELTRAIEEMMRVLKEDGAVALVFGHASFAGWCAWAEALRAAPVEITQVTPLAIEREARPRAMRSRSVDTCFLFVGRHCTSKPAVSERTWRAQIRRVDADDAPTAFARGLASVANVSSIGAKALSESIAALETRVAERFDGFALRRRRSL